jgi:hypothetical protein
MIPISACKHPPGRSARLEIKLVIIQDKNCAPSPLARCGAWIDGGYNSGNAISVFSLLVVGAW